jgi:hypothetical protein
MSQNNDSLPTMRVTDPHGIGLDTTALDIVLLDENSVRVWLCKDGLRIEANTGNRLRIEVKGPNSLLVSVED